MLSVTGLVIGFHFIYGHDEAATACVEEINLMVYRLPEGVLHVETFHCDFHVGADG